MRVPELEEIKNLATSFIRNKRTKEEILLSLQIAGIITKEGHLKDPYKDIFTPIEKP